MPSRTFTGIDLLNYNFVATPTLTQINGSATANGVNTSQGVATGTISGSINTVVGCDVEAQIEINISGDLPYDAFPALPSNVQVTGIDVQVEMSFNVSGSGTSAFPWDMGCNGTAEILADGSAGNIPFTALDLSQSDTDSANNPSVSISQSRTLSTHFTDTFGTPMSRADFVAQYQTLLINLIISGAGFRFFPQTITGAFSGTITLNNFRFLINYEDLPVTMSPAGGQSVESGSRVTLTSDDIDMTGLVPGLVIGDKIVVLDPDSVSPTELVFTIPEPATPECLECFDDCPDCDDCITACEDDFDSAECQECLEECFDCLLECLDFEGLAEECLGAIPEDSDPQPVTVVLNDPTGTQFSGTVPLGTLFVITANGSGIYRIVTNKTNDTIYSSVRDGSTYDTKIPNPKFKTGFVRG